MLRHFERIFRSEMTFPAQAIVVPAISFLSLGISTLTASDHGDWIVSHLVGCEAVSKQVSRKAFAKKWAAQWTSARMLTSQSSKTRDATSRTTLHPQTNYQEVKAVSRVHRRRLDLKVEERCVTKARVVGH